MNNNNAFLNQYFEFVYRATHCSAREADSIIHNPYYPTNYLRTCAVLMHARVNRMIPNTLFKPELYHPWELDELSTFACNITDPCRARLFEINHDRPYKDRMRFIYVNNLTWIKRYTLTIHPDNDPLTQKYLHYLSTPEINTLIQTSTAPEKTINYIPSLGAAIASNPYLTIESAEKLLDVFTRPSLSGFIPFLLKNEALPFNQLIQLITKYRCTSINIYSHVLAQRSDCPREFLDTWVNPYNVLVYTSTDSDINKFLRYHRAAHTRMGVFRHRNISAQTKQRILNTKNHFLIKECLSYGRMGHFNLLTFDSTYAEPVTHCLKINDINRRLEPVWRYMVDSANDRNTFFIETESQWRDVMSHIKTLL